MARGTWAVGWILVLGCVSASDALADKVTLTNGDVLHGEVTEQGGRVKIEHALLGEVDVARAHVMWISREGEVPPPATAGAAAARRVAAPCASCPDGTAAELEAVEACESPWDFSVGVGLSNEAGNTEKFKLNTDLEAGYTRGPHELRWRLTGYYEEARGTQTEGKYFSNLGYKRRVSPRGSLFGAWVVDRDDFADIEIRNGWFVGYEHAFVKRKRTTFSGNIGAGHVTEKRKDQAWLNTPAAYARLDWKHEFAGGDSLHAYAYVIPYLDQTELSPSRFEIRYAHPLREHLDVVAGLLADYVPEPPDGIDSLDTKLTFSIRWRK